MLGKRNIPISMVFLEKQVFISVLNCSIGKLFQESIFQGLVEMVKPVLEHFFQLFLLLSI